MNKEKNSMNERMTRLSIINFHLAYILIHIFRGSTMESIINQIPHIPWLL